MDQTHGTWGTRTVTYQDDYHIVTILQLDPNQRCSWHGHTSSYNQFYCITGVVGIKTQCGPGDQTRTIKLHPGQIFTVPPRVIHEFITWDQWAIVEEIAYVKYDPNDIDRLELGGATNNARNEQAR